MSLSPQLQLEEVVKTIPSGSTHVAKILMQLGIPFNRRAGFWLRNEGRLHYIYHDFCLALRDWRKANHPDRGGDPNVYKRFNAACENLKRRFSLRGIGPRESAISKDEKWRRNMLHERMRGRAAARMAYWTKKKRNAACLAIFIIGISACNAAKTQKSFHLAWDPVSYSVSFYTVFQYSALIGDYLPIGTVLFPAPTRFTIPKGTIMGTIYMVTATDTNWLESLHSADCPLTKPPK